MQIEVIKSNIFKFIKYILFLAIGIALLYFAFKDNNPQKMFNDIRQADYLPIVLGMLCGLLAFVSRAHRWLILLEPLNYHPKMSNSLYAVCVGYIANLAVPRIGELTRCTAFNQVEKIPVKSLFGTVILERVIDMLILSVIIITVIFIKIEMFGSFFTQLFKEKLNALHFSTTALFITIFIVVIVILLLYKFRSLFAHLHLYQKTRQFIKGIIEGFTTIFQLNHKGLFIFHTLFIWLMYFLMTYICFFSIEATSELSLVDGLFIMAVGGIGMSAPVQGGIGVYHIMVASALALYGIGTTIDPETGAKVSQGLVYATIVHTSQTLLVLICGSISMLMLYFEKKKLSKI